MKRESNPPRQYDNFQSAIEDVKAGRIYRLNIETFAEDIKKEINSQPEPLPDLIPIVRPIQEYTE
jgi:hypothetical protein